MAGHAVGAAAAPRHRTAAALLFFRGKYRRVDAKDGTTAPDIPNTADEPVQMYFHELKRSATAGREIDGERGRDRDAP